MCQLLELAGCVVGMLRVTIRRPAHGLDPLAVARWGRVSWGEAVCGLCQGADSCVLVGGDPDQPEGDGGQVVDGYERDLVVAEAVLHRCRGGEHDVSPCDEAGYFADGPHRCGVDWDGAPGGG
jgi:hypothetical protein